MTGPEVLQNFERIQDLNYARFLSYAKEFAESYRDEIFATVIKEKHYQKKTISFLKEVLSYYGVSNNLSEYLSRLSEYKHPSMEEIYEAAYKSWRISWVDLHRGTGKEHFWIRCGTRFVPSINQNKLCNIFKTFTPRASWNTSYLSLHRNNINKIFFFL